MRATGTFLFHFLLICLLSTLAFSQLSGPPGLTGPSAPTGPGLPSGLPTGLPTGLPNPPGTPGPNTNDSSSGNNEAFATIAMTNETYSVFTTNPVVTITVLRLGNNEGECTVNFTTADGTAISGSDYGGGSGQLVWANGDMEDQTITMQINPQMLTGTQKNFSVILYGPYRAYLGFPNIASVTIFADAIWNPPAEPSSSSSSTGTANPNSSTGEDVQIFGEDESSTDYAKILGLSIGLGGGGLLVAAIGGLSYWQWKKRQGLMGGNASPAAV